MLMIFAFPSLALAFVSQFRLKVNTDRSQLGRSLQVYLPSVCPLGELLIDYIWRLERASYNPDVVLGEDV